MTTEAGSNTNGLSGLLEDLADRIADRVLARIAAAPAKPYTTDPRRLNLPAGWSKRAWDDAGRLAESSAKRPPLRKDPRGYSCAAEAFEAWAAGRKRTRKVVAIVETDDERRARQIADLQARRERRAS